MVNAWLALSEASVYPEQAGEMRKGVQVDQGEEPAEGKNSWLGLILLRDEQAGEEGWYGDVYG